MTCNLVTILGLGNLLLKDDGIGPHVIQQLKKEGLPPGVDAIEAGGSFFEYWNVMARSSHIIVVDSLLGGETPGTVYWLTPDKIARNENPCLLQHEDDFLSILKIMAYFDIRPQVSIIGVEPKEIAYSLELSPEVSKKIPSIIELIKKQYTLLLRDSNSCCCDH